MPPLIRNRRYRVTVPI
ncbi:hypothetical protein YPPY36_2010, partial [Yersinia pestis PY-36]